ncbi:MAG: P-loop NTPase [Phycisphaerae bacterium]|nr:P-loop NTPase [Phycisphaerae bacterium]
MTDSPTQSPPDDARRQDQARQLKARMARIGRKLLVLSGKGGVGKSTIATHLAVALGEAGKTVGLLDVDLHGPSVVKILGLEGRRMAPSPSGGIAPVPAGTNLSVVSIAMMLEGGADAVIWRGPMKYNVIRQFLADVAWGALDYLVIDSPPGTGDEPLAVAQMVGDGAQAVVVTTPQDLAVSDVRRSVSFCRTLNLPVAGIVENMSQMVCPHCGERIDPFKTGGGEALAGEVGVPFLGRVPLDPQIVLTGDSGTTAHAGGAGPAAAALTAVVQSIQAAQRTAPPAQPQESHTMTIAIPLANGQLAMHFGHCEQFALIDADADAKSVTNTRYVTPPPHEPGVLPRWLGEQGAEVIITGGMGRRAQALFAQSGIRVVVGATPAPPEDVAAAYLAGTLETGDNVCDH